MSPALKKERDRTGCEQSNLGGAREIPGFYCKEEMGHPNGVSGIGLNIFP